MKKITVEEIILMGLTESIEWQRVVLKYTLDSDVLRKFKHLIPWEYVTCCQYLSNKDIIEFKEFFNEKCLNNILKYQNIQDLKLKQQIYDWINECNK